MFCYRNCIYNMKKCRIGNVLSYKDCIDDIIKQSNNWFGAMCLAIDIYHGNITSFPGVPTTDNSRKKNWNLI